MFRGTKIRIHLDVHQCQQLAIQFGCARWMYNNALTHRKQVYEETGGSVSKNVLIKRLPELKQEHLWLKSADAQVLQAVVAKQNSFPLGKGGYSQ